MTDIEQEEKEAPGKFLDRLREGLCRFTEIDPESEEGKVILKDRFLTQSAPDIRRKLLKHHHHRPESHCSSFIDLYTKENMTMLPLAHLLTVGV